MKIYYLYKKTHRTTGLKYLGKTTKPDPHIYPGSGTYWTSHIKAHGDNCETEIIKECASNEELRKWGIYYSKLWNIVESTEWANLKEECGDGGDTSMTENYKKYQYIMSDQRSKYRWWNNGVDQVHSESPPDKSYTKGRLPFNNIGAAAAALVQSEKIWITNGEEETMIHHSSPIPELFRVGRLNAFPNFEKGSHTRGTTWWNNGEESRMSKTSPGQDWNKGRLKRTKNNIEF